MRYLGPSSSATLLSLPAAAEAGVVALRDGGLETIVMLTDRAGRVEHFETLVDPFVLAPIAKALGSRERHPF